ncbi:MAG: hydantoinase B/oxoprolinase family protein [Phycisphaeraceae bacterium]|nr:hydantoinase B/oxoprolinase family protein [Phycisphaeraceae bacterium]
MSERRWEIWVDTGGTFTDALGRGPNGAIHRAKVLSTGRLRTRIARVIDGATVQLEANWAGVERDSGRGRAGGMASADRLPSQHDAVAGWSLAPLGSSEPGVPIESSSGGLLRLARADARWRIGQVVELHTGDEAPVLAARLLTGTTARGTLPPIRMRLATTRGTNALLTGAMARTALFINRGLEDLPRIGTQQRAELFNLDIRRERMLAAETVGIIGRLDARGREIEPPDLDHLRREADRLLRTGIRDAAVALLHSDLNSAHEDAVAACLLDSGFERVSCSARLAPFVKILPRATTAQVNAALAPVIDGYLSRVRAALSAPGSSLLVMGSAGGLWPAEQFAAKDSLLSGPAAGVVGAAAAASSAGCTHAVSFDMGGTSTDAARWTRDAGCEMVFEHTVGGAMLLAPAVGVETVAAGGGSVCAFRDGVLAVGPQSAGAEPGPACYGAGGPLTLTDVNLLLGRLCTERFAIPIDRDAAEHALERVRSAAEASTGRRWPAEMLLQGFLDIAAERMAGAVQRISTRRGHDLRGAMLVAFGGAGGQHACAVAARLGVRSALAPVDAGLLSAAGLAAARVERLAERQVLLPLAECDSHIDGWLQDLCAQAVRAAASAGVGESGTQVRRRIAALRLVGQETPIEIDLAAQDGAQALTPLFDAAYRRVYGYVPEGRAVEVVWLRVLAASAPAVSSPPAAAGSPACAPPAPARTQPACFDGVWTETRVFERSELRAGDEFAGPAIIAEDHATVVIEPDWRARMIADGAIVIESSASPGAGPPRSAMADASDPASLELFTARFESIARDMGEALARTSVSVNVKERLDFSCALLDARGSLVACAPHVPVHLGSLGVCVRAVREALPLNPGDSAITNHPAHGGSHLPDITVITPVHDDASTLIGYVASRAHHAEIGGSRPGSMPPDARTLREEGVVLAPFRIVEGGQPRLDALAARLAAGPFPSRNIDDNLADVRAALAANARGAEELRALSRTHGAPAVALFMEAIQQRSAALLRERLRELPLGTMHADDAMDDGSPVRVSLDNRGDELVIDFAGSGPGHAGNLNATPAIVRSCIVYALRILLARPVPLNEGLMRPVRVLLPEGMLNPRFEGDDGPAVVGGNVETSQRVVDVLLRALGLCADSQGTMNNFVFAEARADAPSYYETIGGGAGAGPAFAGASSVHTHMTNTRITDAEILERRYPVRLERFAVRRGSGGAGLHVGGDGIERRVRFLAPAKVSLLTQRRTRGPHGAAGGADGAPGEQSLHRTGGQAMPLAPCTSFDAAIGDVLTIRTPGGGGWGAAHAQP